MSYFFQNSSVYVYMLDFVTKQDDIPYHNYLYIVQLPASFASQFENLNNC